MIFSNQDGNSMQALKHHENNHGSPVWKGDTIELPIVTFWQEVRDDFHGDSSDVFKVFWIATLSFLYLRQFLWRIKTDWAEEWKDEQWWSLFCLTLFRTCGLGGSYRQAWFPSRCVVIAGSGEQSSVVPFEEKGEVNRFPSRSVFPLRDRVRERERDRRAAAYKSPAPFSPKEIDTHGGIKYLGDFLGA